jgi:MGT family glycosyltransferase|tara:strand:+ start:9441 stop:10709 length:1269 start_codon:yes stop_codon:yes gene_type:complete
MKTIVFFPEAAFGPALNSVGIAQEVEKLGHKAIFICDKGFEGVFKDYGFEEHTINMSEPMSADAMAKYWVDFINGHIPNFDKTPYEQIDTYIKDCWEAIVETAIWAEKDLPQVLDKIKPDVVCIDNVILFPATKSYGKPWVRILSCSENEIADENIPPYLSGCGENDKDGFKKFNEKFIKTVAPIHKKFNNFLKECNEDEYPVGEFFETSPYLNLLLYPEAVKFNRSKPLDKNKFHYLHGCVRKDKEYTVPNFKKNNNSKLIYLSFGSLGSGDIDLMKRLINTLGKSDYKILVNVGDYKGEYIDIPDNVIIDSWYPQPSVIPQCDLVIHHGGNNSFTECLYFGVPAIIMPYVWDGQDNATRVHETKHGIKMHRSKWEPSELLSNIESTMNDSEIKNNLIKASEFMQLDNGTKKAASLIVALV